ncbi:MAG: efflux RND transporter periplasmic adaptor subunit [Verrucomicrobiota bacterium]
MTRRWITSALLGLMTVAWNGCKRPADGPTGGPGGPGRPGGPMAVQVVAVPARQRPVTEVVPLVGSIAANESVEVKCEADGTVAEIRFEEGQRVEKGALLVALDETKFKATLGEAEAGQRLAEANFKRAQQLADGKLISQAEFEQASATFTMNEATVELRRRNLRDARILAPFSGIVGARLVSPGQVISRQSTLTSLVDLDTVKVEMNVPERNLGQVSVGQKIRFRVDSYPKDLFEGDVYFVSPQLDAATRTALVKARVTNRDGRLRAGMFAKLDLAIQLRDDALVVPEPALLSNGDAFSVFVVTPQTNVVIRPVKVGLRLAGKAEIVSGLTNGEVVVVEGHQKLFPGAPVKLAPEASAAAYKD